MKPGECQRKSTKDRFWAGLKYCLVTIQGTKIKSKTFIKSHIYDGAALTKFLFWIKNNYRKQSINEISAQVKLLKFRKENKSFRNII